MIRLPSTRDVQIDNALPQDRVLVHPSIPITPHQADVLLLLPHPKPLAWNAVHQRGTRLLSHPPVAHILLLATTSAEEAMEKEAEAIPIEGRARRNIYPRTETEGSDLPAELLRLSTAHGVSLMHTERRRWRSAKFLVAMVVRKASCYRQIGLRPNPLVCRLALLQPNPSRDRLQFMVGLLPPLLRIMLLRVHRISSPRLGLLLMNIARANCGMRLLRRLKLLL